MSVNTNYPECKLCTDHSMCDKCKETPVVEEPKVEEPKVEVENKPVKKAGRPKKTK